MSNLDEIDAPVIEQSADAAEEPRPARPRRRAARVAPEAPVESAILEPTRMEHPAPAEESVGASVPGGVEASPVAATTAVLEAPTSEQGRQEHGSRERDGGRRQRGGRFDRNRGDRNDRNERDDRPERGNRADRNERPAQHRQRDNGHFANGHSPYIHEPVPPRPDFDIPQFTVTEVAEMPMEELHELAKTFELTGYSRMKRTDLISKLLQTRTELEGNTFGDGVLDITEEGYGFLRGQRFLPGPDDIYVSQSQIRRFGLRTGDRVSGQVRPPKDSEKFFSMLRVEAVNGVDPEVARRRPGFDTLTPIFPLELIDLETMPNVLSTRLLNLVAPIGRGQRGLIVSPPKAGKTLLLKAIANGITTNNPDMHLMVCLIGERPEEVTDMRRSVEGEVISSTFDEPVEDHTKVAEMALERAKRLVEAGRDVTILLDSITRLARAYNLAVPPSGRTLSGGIDPVALYPPKRFFGAARNIEGGGSLTIVATCLVDTGSRMDDVIYEEFKGTGNMELHLDRKLAERRVYPSIDIQRSGTRREELLLDDATLRQVWTMRRMVSMLGGTEGTELLLSRLSKTQTNDEFLLTLNKDL